MSSGRNLSISKRKSHFRNIVSLATKDGTIGDEEKQVLAFVANKWGLTDDEITEVTTKPDNVIISFPTDREDCFHQLYDIVEVMIIDGVVNKGERQLCDALAVKLGFEVSAVDTVIKGILDGNISMKREEDIQAGLMKQLL